MSEAKDFEHLLWNEAPDSSDRSVDAAELQIQLDVHRLLRATVSAQRKPEVSSGFDAALARRLVIPTVRRVRRPPTSMA